jgi:hypothetical protein
LSIIRHEDLKLPSKTTISIVVFEPNLSPWHLAYNKILRLGKYWRAVPRLQNICSLPRFQSVIIIIYSTQFLPFEKQNQRTSQHRQSADINLFRKRASFSFWTEDKASTSTQAYGTKLVRDLINWKTNPSNFTCL